MKISEVDAEMPRKRVDWYPIFEAALGKPGQWFEGLEPGLHAGTIRNMAKEVNAGKRFAQAAKDAGGSFEAMSRKREAGTALLIRFVKDEF